MGEDKAQITTWIGVSEEGEVLPYQNIYGGKTNRCHPKHEGVLWSHTESHWQTPATYIDVIKSIIIPYRNRQIALLGLPADQWMILKHDLHYSHTDAEVLNFMKENRIASLFVTAKCTDEMQECDVVINKPYKDGVRQAFRDYLDDNFQKHCDGGLEPALWEPKITVGNFKPFITGFVNKGMENISTPSPEMKEAIRNCVEERGFFGMMRSPMMQQEAREQLDHEAAIALIEQVPVSEGDG